MFPKDHPKLRFNQSTYREIKCFIFKVHEFTNTEQAYICISHSQGCKVAEEIKKKLPQEYSGADAPL